MILELTKQNILNLTNESKRKNILAAWRSWGIWHKAPEIGQGVYKKHLVYLNDWTIYVVEDVSGAYVDKFHYEVNFLPEMIIPVTVTSHD